VQPTHENLESCDIFEFSGKAFAWEIMGQIVGPNGGIFWKFQNSLQE